MKRFFLIIILLLALVAGGYYGYKYWEDNKDITLWELVPANALMVYETNQFAKNWNEIAKTKIWIGMEDIPFFQNINGNIQLLDSVAGHEGKFEQLLKNNPLIISAHLVSKNQMDFVFYMQLNTVNQKEAGLKILKNFKANPELIHNERTYLGYEINELKNKKGQTFTYLIYKNSFIGSFTSFLIEDVIRTVEGSSRNFKTEQQALFDIAHLGEGQGDLYLNSAKASSFVRLVSGEALPNINYVLDKLSSGSFLDIKVENNRLNLNGFSINTQEENFLSLFRNQTAKGLLAKNYIPNKTAYFYHFTFSNTATWFDKLDNFNARYDSTAYEQSIKESRKYRTDYKKFGSFTDGEIGVAVLSGVEQKTAEKLLYIRTADLNEALAQFNKLAEEAAELQKDTLYWENFANEKLTQLQIKDFPQLWLGQQFKGFEDVFYTAIDQYIIIANNIQTLKNLITDLEAENTWGKSLRQNKFLDATLSDANLSLYVNIPRSWEMLKSVMNPEWQKLLNSFPIAIKSLDLMAFQFSNVDDKFYTNIEVNYKENEFKDAAQRFELLREVSFDVPIISKPYVVRNHYSNEYEVLVQDSTYALHLIGSDGSILWTDTLSSALSTDIHQIDFYNNGKLQYIFATANHLHIIDRNGVSVENWPQRMPAHVEISNLSVVDYDRSKNYRFMLTDVDGNIYLFDKTKKLLDGWNPYKIGGRLSTAARHVRVRGRDYMVALQSDGKLHIMNRRGERQRGFPVNLSDRVNTNLHFKIGVDETASEISLINEGGELMKIGFDGRIRTKQQLYKPTAKTNFQLIEDGLKRTYIIIRQDMNRVSVLDKDGVMRFDKDYLTEEQMKVQYYNFGVNNEIIAVTDETEEFTYLYNANGDLIYYQPLESSFPIAMLHFEADNKFFVYKCYQNKLTLVSFFQ